MRSRSSFHSRFSPFTTSCTRIVHWKLCHTGLFQRTAKWTERAEISPGESHTGACLRSSGMTMVKTHTQTRRNDLMREFGKWHSPVRPVGVVCRFQKTTAFRKTTALALASTSTPSRWRSSSTSETHTGSCPICRRNYSAATFPAVNHWRLRGDGTRWRGRSRAQRRFHSSVCLLGSFVEYAGPPPRRSCRVFVQPQNLLTSSPG